MSDLIQMKNIGKTLAEKLIQVDINSSEALKQAGCESAFLKIKTIDQTACLNMLYALEGAIQEIRWHSLDAACKAELKTFYEMTLTVDKLEKPTI